VIDYYVERFGTPPYWQRKGLRAKLLADNFCASAECSKLAVGNLTGEGRHAAVG
jgi:hypothetical protein